MNPIGALYDEDGLPKYILHSDGHIEKRMVNESIKKTIYAVMKTRLDRDYPVERKVSISMLIINESGSTNPEVLEFKRRVKEVDDLKV